MNKKEKEIGQKKKKKKKKIKFGGIPRSRCFNAISPCQFRTWFLQSGTPHNSDAFAEENTEKLETKTSQPKEKMSWQTYVDDHLMCEIDGNHLTSAAIIGQDGSVWAQSSNFPQVRLFFTLPSSSFSESMSIL